MEVVLQVGKGIACAAFATPPLADGRGIVLRATAHESKLQCKVALLKPDNITLVTELNCSLVSGKFYVELFAEQTDTCVSLLSCAFTLMLRMHRYTI